MTDEKRSKYYKEADHLRALHRIQHPDYKYSPKTSKQVGLSLLSSRSSITIVADITGSRWPGDISQ